MAESVRLQKNQDLLDKGVWIRHPDTHLVHLVMHKAHVARLLNEGGVQVAGPENPTPVAVEAHISTIAELQRENARLKAQLEGAHGSTQHDGTIDSPREAAKRVAKSGVG